MADRDGAKRILSDEQEDLLTLMPAMAEVVAPSNECDQPFCLVGTHDKNHKAFVAKGHDDNASPGQQQSLQRPPTCHHSLQALANGRSGYGMPKEPKATEGLRRHDVAGMCCSTSYSMDRFLMDTDAKHSHVIYDLDQTNKVLAGLTEAKTIPVEVIIRNISPPGDDYRLQHIGVWTYGQGAREAPTAYFSINFSRQVTPDLVPEFFEKEVNGEMWCGTRRHCREQVQEHRLHRSCRPFCDQR